MCVQIRKQSSWQLRSYAAMKVQLLWCACFCVLLYSYIRVSLVFITPNNLISVLYGVSGRCSTPTGRWQSEKVYSGSSGRWHSQRGWGAAPHGDVREATAVRRKDYAVDFQPSVLPAPTRLRQHHIQVERRSNGHHDFYRATLCCAVLVIVILSVCPSICHTRGLCPHGSTYDHYFFTAYDSPMILVSGDITFIPKFEGGYPERGRWMRVGWVRIGDFRPISRHISETVRDTTKVTIDH